MKFGKLTLAGVFLGLVWLGIVSLLHSDSEAARLQRYTGNIARSLDGIDPHATWQSFAARVECGSDGACDGCHTTRERIFKVECGSRLPREISAIVLPGLESPKKRVDLGVLSAPAAALFMAKRAWSSGWLILIPGLCALTACMCWCYCSAGLRLRRCICGCSDY